MKELRENRHGGTSEYETWVSFHQEGNILFYKICAFNSSLNSYSHVDNDPLYRGDVVEVFLDLGDKDFYYEFEVAPNGTVFVARKYPDSMEFIDRGFFRSKSTISGHDYEVDIQIDLTNLLPYKTLKHNVYRIETEGCKQEGVLLALEPTLCDYFHIRSKFIDFKESSSSKKNAGDIHVETPDQL